MIKILSPLLLVIGLIILSVLCFMEDIKVGFVFVGLVSILAAILLPLTPDLW